MQYRLLRRVPPILLKEKSSELSLQPPQDEPFRPEHEEGRKNDRTAYKQREVVLVLRSGGIEVSEAEEEENVRVSEKPAQEAYKKSEVENRIRLETGRRTVP